MTAYFLEALQGALHGFITPKHVGERAFHRVQVCQSGFLLRCHSVQSLLGALVVALHVL